MYFNIVLTRFAACLLLFLYNQRQINTQLLISLRSKRDYSAAKVESQGNYSAPFSLCTAHNPNTKKIAASPSFSLPLFSKNLSQKGAFCYTTKHEC